MVDHISILMKRFLITILLFSSLLCKGQASDTSLINGGAGVIFIDFDGGYITGTLWNAAYGGNIAYSPASFHLSADSMDFVVNYVKECYLPFNVIVTRDSTLFFRAAHGKRIREPFTPSYQWNGAATGGVTNINSITFSGDEPSWAFQVANPSGDPLYNLKTISDLCAHEPAHAIGLRHQSTYDGSCVKTEYNVGTGSGQTGVAPIMGNPYTKNMALWYYGTSALSCASYQDDIAAIASVFGYKADDVGNLPANAKKMQKDTAYISALTSISDSDYYKFTVPVATAVTITSLPYSFGPSNLYSKMKCGLVLKTENQGIIATSANSTLDASITATLSPGTYYIVAKILPTTENPTGYGEAGHYTLTFTY